MGGFELVRHFAELTAYRDISHDTEICGTDLCWSVCELMDSAISSKGSERPQKIANGWSLEAFVFRA